MILFEKGDKMIEEALINRRIKTMWALAWPVMFSQILQTLLEIVDMYFISTIGIVDAIAATGISTSILGVIIVISQLIATGAIALISRKTGENDQEGTVSISEQALILSLIIGIFVMIICYIYAPSLLFLFGVEEAVEKHALTYLRIVLIGVPFTFFNLTGRSILQAKGDTKTPMLIFVGMNIINICLDPILIYGFLFFPRLGFKGAALATAISNIFAFIFMIIVIKRKVFDNRLSIILNNLKINISIMYRIIKIGFFSAIQAISRPITGLVMYKIANYAGTEAVAAFTIGGRMFNLVFVFLAGLNMAISVLTGQSLGKKDSRAVEETVGDGIKLAAINMVVFAIPYFIFAKYLMLLFTQDLSVVSIGVHYLRITYAGILFVIFPMVYGGVFVGSGDTAPPMIASLVANWGFKLPFAYIFSQIFAMGANGVWLAISLSVICEAAIIAFWFRKGKWKEKKI